MIDSDGVYHQGQSRRDGPNYIETDGTELYSLDVYSFVRIDKDGFIGKMAGWRRCPRPMPDWEVFNYGIRPERVAIDPDRSKVPHEQERFQPTGEKHQANE